MIKLIFKAYKKTYLKRLFFLHIKVTIIKINNYYKKHKERLQEEARQKY